MMKLDCIRWKWGQGHVYHLNLNTGKIIIDIWNLPPPEPTTAEIQTASNDYDAYLISQDSKYLQYLSKIAGLDYDQIDTYISGISTMAQAKVFMKRMAFGLVALTNILKEDRRVK